MSARSTAADGRPPRRVRAGRRGGTTGRTRTSTASAPRHPRRSSRRPRLRRGRLLGLVVLVLVPAIGAAVLWYAPFLRLEQVEYRTAPDRMAALRKAAPLDKGRPLVEVDTDAVHDAVLRDPVFTSASVDRSWPSTLVVEATPRTPVVAVEGGEGASLRLVAADGVAYETVSSPPRGIPRARVDAPEDPAALRGLVSFVTRLDADLLSEARDLHVDTRGRITATIGGVEVVWGSAEDPALKAAVVRNLVSRAGVARIDVSVPMEPVTSHERRGEAATPSPGSTASGPGPSGSPTAGPSAGGTGERSG